MGNNFKYIVYQTINTVNNKIYIGVHQTETPDVFDNYLGNGFIIGKTNHLLEHPKEPFHYALKKYGVKSFKRITLKICDTREEALLLEAKLVNYDFISRSDTYNIALGGGNPPLLNKVIYLFSIKGELIKEWESITLVKKYFDTSASFNDIVNLKRSFAGSFWNFTDTIDISLYKTELNYGYISLYSLSGVFIAMYRNATVAALKLDLDRQAITTAVFKLKLYNGYYFIKSDVDIANVLANKFKKLLGKKPIYRYLESGEFNAEFETTSKAVNATPKAHTSALKNAVINGYLCGGFRWSYIKSDNYFNIENPKLKEDVKIGLYDLNHNLIKVWNSPKECKKEYKYCLRVCRGEMKTTQGYIFQYI